MNISNPPGPNDKHPDVYTLLERLDPPATSVPDTQEALIHFRTTLDTHSEVSITSRQKWAPSSVPPPVLMQQRSKKRPALLLVGAAALLFAVLFLTTAPAIAEQFFSLFRVQQLQPVSVDFQQMDQQLLLDLANLGEIEFQTSEESELVSTATREQVQQAVTFSLQSPTILPKGIEATPQYQIVHSKTGTFTFSAENTRQYLDKSGQSSIEIPEQLHKASFIITIDAGVITSYPGTCSADTQQQACTTPSNLFIAQIPGPVIEATGNASLKDLRDFMLSLPKLTPEMRKVLEQVDLEHGIVPLPIPSQFHTNKTTINGMPGVMVVDEAYKIGGILWQRDGIIYAVGADQVTGEELQTTAQSLR